MTNLYCEIRSTRQSPRLYSLHRPTSTLSFQERSCIELEQLQQVPGSLLLPSHALCHQGISRLGHTAPPQSTRASLWPWRRAHRGPWLWRWQGRGTPQQPTHTMTMAASWLIHRPLALCSLPSIANVLSDSISAFHPTVPRPQRPIKNTVSLTIQGFGRVHLPFLQQATHTAQAALRGRITEIIFGSSIQFLIQVLVHTVEALADFRAPAR